MFGAHTAHNVAGSHVGVSYVSVSLVASVFVRERKSSGCLLFASLVFYVVRVVKRVFCCFWI